MADELTKQNRQLMHTITLQSCASQHTGTNCCVVMHRALGLSKAPACGGCAISYPCLCLIANNKNNLFLELQYFLHRLLAVAERSLTSRNLGLKLRLDAGHLCLGFLSLLHLQLQFPLNFFHVVLHHLQVALKLVAFLSRRALLCTNAF